MKIDMKLRDGSEIHVESQPMGKERFNALCGLAAGAMVAGFFLALFLGIF